ncbi:aldose epimerase family protein [Oceanobacillus locisalsi]|uniref:Aldose 1-epimerase n=1 Tax=Oceanobacillus locisalsi TaxID=546107 RepID=A0ABW3NDP2_9BACI
MKVNTKYLNETWKLFILKNDLGMEINILNFGGIITKISTPGKNGKVENVVLGYDNYKDYKTDPYFFGAIIGRVAGRIENAHFSLNGKQYELETNDGVNHLHGGSNGFHQVLWEGETFESDAYAGVTLHYISSDGENGFPGNVKTAVTYTLTNDNELILDYWAQTDETTPFTLTNHSYFNLTGNLRDTIHNHHVTIASHQFAELDDALIPTGKLLDVKNTPFDFTQGQKLREGIVSNTEQNQIVGNGFDHYFIFDYGKKENVFVREETSGRTLTIETNQPGMVMYTSNNLDDGITLSEGTTKKYLGVCFETQGFAGSLHGSNFPSIILKAGDKYQKRTAFRFGIDY